jgi:DNA invertase Pin-like site-specific DNA recombinase
MPWQFRRKAGGQAHDCKGQIRTRKIGRTRISGKSQEGEQKMKCAIYARVSTRDKGQEFQNQIIALRQFASTQCWPIVAEYIDQQSAKDSDREQFQHMFQDASTRKFDVLLFWSLDRLSREGVLETLQHLQRLTSYGVAWRSFTEQFLDSTGIFRDAVIGILAVIAKQERVRLAERTRAGLERVRREGKKLGRPVALADPGLIRQMREQGTSWSEIARRTRLSRGTVQKVSVKAVT